MEKNNQTNPKIRLLLIEDNPGDTRLFKEYLRVDTGVDYTVYTAETLADGLEKLTRYSMDIVITDLGLSDSQGLDTPRLILDAYPALPVIITTGIDDEKLGIDSIKFGVQDYLVKSKITPSLLVQSIKFSIEQKKIIEELKKSKDELWQQRELIEHYYDSAPIGLAVLDKQMHYLLVNKRLAEINKLPVEAHLGRTISEVVPLIGDVSDEFAKLILSSGVPIKNVELQQEISALHDSPLTCITNWYPLKNPAGEITGFSISVEDVTERKKAETALVQSEMMFRKLLSTSPEAIIRMDSKSRICAFSDVTPGILGYETKVDLNCIPFFRFISPDDRKKVKEVFERIKSEGSVHNLEIGFVKHDKSTFLGEISIALIDESDGNPNGYIAIIRDITSRRIMEMQMIHNARMLSLGEMAAGIAHEINQPLNIISITLENLMVEVLENNANDKTYLKTKSEKIFSNITRMRNIIDHIRSFSRDHNDLIHGIFDIHESITNAISMVSEQFRHRLIELNLDFDKSINMYPGDIYKFEQVVLNLLTNSKDAIEEKHKGNKFTGKKVVNIRTHQDDQSIYVEVEDNGIGIKTTEIEKVMLPFFTTKETGKGTGLGLSISYGIIKEMKGTVAITSKRNTGTTVRITLPLNPEKSSR